MKEYQAWQRAWQMFLKRLVDLKAAWPGLWVLIIGSLPRRVWSTRGPDGQGASGETPEEAADFLESESEIQATDYPSEGYKAVKFTGEELRRLWWPGARIEKDGWSIRCTLIRRGVWGLYEWEGW